MTIEHYALNEHSAGRQKCLECGARGVWEWMVDDTKRYCDKCLPDKYRILYALQQL